jgi:hypothetical protein
VVKNEEDRVRRSFAATVERADAVFVEEDVH